MKPKFPLFDSGDPSLAKEADRMFGSGEGHHTTVELTWGKKYRGEVLLVACTCGWEIEIPHNSGSDYEARVGRAVMKHAREIEEEKE